MDTGHIALPPVNWTALHQASYDNCVEEGRILLDGPNIDIDCEDDADCPDSGYCGENNKCNLEVSGGCGKKRAAFCPSGGQTKSYTRSDYKLF